VGTLGGGTAALLIAWHPSVLDEVRMARCYGLVLLLAALAFWATVCWRKRPEQRRWILVWAAANAGLVWTHYVTLPLIPLQLLVLAGLLPLSSQRQRPIWSQLIVAVLLLVLLLLPLWPSFFRMWEFRELLNYNKEGVAVWKIIGPIWWLGLPAGWAAGALVSLFVATRPSTSRLPANFWTLLAWGLLPVCLVAVFSRGNLTSLSNPRYCLPYAVPAACLLASCLTFRRGAWASAAAVIVTLAAAWLMNDLAPWQMRRLGDRSAADWHEMAQQLQRDGRTGEPVFVLAGLIESSMVPAEPFRRDDLFMDYVSCRLGRFYVQTHHPRYGLPLLWHAEWKLQEFYKDVLQTHCDADAETVWVAVATDTDLNRTSLARFQELLVSQGYIESATHQWSSAVLIRYLCPSAASTRR
jgi:hypothetical protein